MNDALPPFVISPNLRIHGDLVLQQDVVVDAHFDGNICAEGHTVTVRNGAVLRADIRATTVVVHGQVTGAVKARGNVEIGPTGSIDGSIASFGLVLAPGARVRGEINPGFLGPATVAAAAPRDNLHSIREAARRRITPLEYPDRPSLPISSDETPY